MFHKHLLVSGTCRDYNSGELVFIESWMDELVRLVDMNILIPTQAVFCETEGNDGITAIVCIDTSHASIHLWNAPISNLRFDLYSCKDFDEMVVLQHLKKLGVFETKYQIIDRN